MDPILLDNLSENNLTEIDLINTESKENFFVIGKKRIRKIETRENEVHYIPKMCSELIEISVTNSCQQLNTPAEFVGCVLGFPKKLSMLSIR